MENRVERTIEGIRDQVTRLSFLSLKAIEKAMRSLKEKDKGKAKQVMADDAVIDEAYSSIEKECFSVLLLDSPFACDFLFISSALKMITDLERIGDYAADIAEEVTYLPSSSHLNIPDLFALSDCVIALLKEAVDAFLNSDVGKARNLAKKDDRIDELFLKVRSDVAHDIDSHALSPEEGIVAALISKYLERIADHGVNLGEWVDYALTGEHGLS